MIKVNKTNSLLNYLQQENSLVNEYNACVEEIRFLQDILIDSCEENPMEMTKEYLETNMKKLEELSTKVKNIRGIIIEIILKYSETDSMTPI